MAVVLGAFAIVAFFIACVLVAFHVSGTELTGALVFTGIFAAALCLFALRQLREVAEKDEGWGAALALYAIAYCALLGFVVALVVSHPIG